MRGVVSLDTRRKDDKQKAERERRVEERIKVRGRETKEMKMNERKVK